ncbi:glycosyltransferase family 2 protein [Microbacterium yannicii]|uniref:Glycosyltransferase family 2 protein n=1 Tax=Microbacterium yannicii TaxID=671622 RepID=A0ABP9MER0_9MICO|nr:glycosyltransferase [Microbacterium yannicii]MCO5953391.1 glycosyltransferase [Microbacterium yannicii]
MSKRVAAVIVTFNRLEKLKTVLDSVRDQTTPPEWIVVVDNASNDGTAGYLASLDDPTLDVTRLEENTGGAGGFATGMKRAYDLGAELFWLMDDDCYPEPEALSHLVSGHSEAMEAMPGGVPFACSLVYFDHDELAEMNIAAPDWKWARLWAQGQRAVLVQTCSFVSALYSRETVERIGLPLRDYFIWFDDAAYARMAGVGIGPGVCILDSKVIHDTPTNVAGDFSKVDEQNIWKFAYGARNEGSYHLHHESLLSYVRFFLRVQILMHRGRVAWRLRRRITGRLLASIGFNPQAERVAPVPAEVR